MKINQLRVKRPYNRIIDTLIEKKQMAFDMKEKKGYPTWMYMHRIRKDTKILNIIPINGRNKFIFTLEKDVRKNNKKSRGGKYEFYEIF